MVILELVKSKCFPILLYIYGLECCNLRSADLHSLDFTYNRPFMKLFMTKSIELYKIYLAMPDFSRILSVCMSTTSMAIFSNALFASYSVYARNASLYLYLLLNFDFYCFFLNLYHVVAFFNASKDVY